ncbi:MAG: lysophospholipid acyltransferase family protein [Gammaproteobacteria bacterium]|nr:lysophospholipid acyltransferase family protein [Gammaproteobacteria bacterium]
MGAVAYYLALPFIYLVSYLPFRALYRLSDLMFFLVYRVIGYRKRVVTTNLERSFPDKSPGEIRAIRSDFYRYFCDLSLETLKTLTVSADVVGQHISCGDMSALERFYEKKQSVIIVMGHLGNWELCGAYFNQLPLHQLYVLYHPLRNRYFDGLFYRMRTRHGTRLYSMKSAFKGMVKDRKELTATAFIADQTPSPSKAYWMTFLNQDTAVFRGTESIAKKLDYPVIYLSVIRERRGHYRLDSELLAEHPRDLPENALTELHTRRLEKDIIAHPEIWLWSHRRWKHRRPGR